MSYKDKWFVILNPVASGGAVRKKWPYVQQLLKEQGLIYDFAITNGPGQAIELAREGVEKGYRKIMAIGGDGTNNEVVNGICMQKVVPSQEIVYTILPLGTGNDWVKMYKISQDIPQCIAACKKMKTRLQDVGVVSYYKNGVQKERYFANVAGMAYDAFLCNEAANLKTRYFKQFFYLFLIFKCLFKYQLRKARLTFDGQVVEDYFYIINAGICRYSGGGMQTVPHAIPDDGLLALTFCRRISKFNVIKSTPMFYSGTVGEHPQVTTGQIKHLKVEAVDDAPTLVEVDGEFLGETPAEFSVLDKALQIIVP